MCCYIASRNKNKLYISIIILSGNEKGILKNLDFLTTVLPRLQKNELHVCATALQIIDFHSLFILRSGFLAVCIWYGQSVHWYIGRSVRAWSVRSLKQRNVRIILKKPVVRTNSQKNL
jgi:hypothetical protein